MTIQRFDTNRRRSRLVIHKGVCHLSGQFSDEGGDIAAQTRETLAKIDVLLARAGTDRSHLLTAQIWLADMADFDAMNEVWDLWIPEGQGPTRCCCAVKLADDEMRIEVMVSAALPE